MDTATYGSEFVAARTAVERIIDLRLTLRYLGVPLRESDYMFGDNENVVGSFLLFHMQSFTRDTQHYLFIVFVKPLLPRWFSSTTSPASSILLISSASIGVISRSGTC